MRSTKRAAQGRGLLVLAICVMFVGTTCSLIRRGSVVQGATRRPVLVATGDIACVEPPMTADPGRRCQYDLVGQLVTSLAPDRFLPLGDLQYTYSGPPDYANYDRYFGSLSSVTSPTPGDSDWEPDPSAYLARFGAAAGPPGGYYSFNLGTWHIISLNSQDCYDAHGCGTGTPQYEWLVADLASHPNSVFPCTLAFFHNPYFLWVSWWQRDGAPRPPNNLMTPFWATLYGAGADVVLNGNAHNYERWAPQDLDGKRSPDGMTEFVVGTGGRRLMPFGPEPRPRNLLTAQDTSYGALQMELDPHGLTYSWKSAAEQPTFRDDGRVACH